MVEQLGALGALQGDRGSRDSIPFLVSMVPGMHVMYHTHTHTYICKQNAHTRKINKIIKTRTIQASNMPCIYHASSCARSSACSDGKAAVAEAKDCVRSP